MKKMNERDVYKPKSMYYPKLSYKNVSEPCLVVSVCAQAENVDTVYMHS